jgi:hypothetical protein
MVVKNPKILDNAQLNELKHYFKASDNSLMVKWNLIKHMQSDLGLDPNIPIKELVKLFFRFEKIKEVFKIKSATFMQLERLLVELETVRDMLSIAPKTPLEQVLHQLISEDITTLGVGKDSSLGHLLRYF